MRALIDVVIARTGLDYYSDKRDVLARLIAARMSLVGAERPGDYRAHLDTDRSGAEWQALESLITIRETFFFRDTAQFEALEKHILPRLLRERVGTRRLRIWSAGCSNGAEPYSLAILLRRMLDSGGVPHAAAWRIDVVGTDLSQFALSEARKAEFRPWSLRGLTREQVAQWFEHLPGQQLWRLKSRYSGMVRFMHGNLLDIASDSGSDDPFDLILCRNVLIYFTPARTATVIKALTERLRTGGWLLLGHAEGGAIMPPTLVAERFPGAQAFHLSMADAHVPLLPGAPGGEAAPCASDVAPPSDDPDTQAADAGSPNVHSILKRARQGASGLEQAWTECLQALIDAPMSPELHYAHAQLATARSEDAIAIEALRRVIYLDRQHVLAHYRLARLLAERDAQAAQRETAHAEALARLRRADEVLPGGDGITAAGFLNLLRTSQPDRQYSAAGES